MFSYLMASIATSSELNKTQQEEYIVKLKVLSNGPTHLILVHKRPNISDQNLIPRRTIVHWDWRQAKLYELI